MDQLDGWRGRIDEIDGRILDLLGERAKCAVEIGRIKSERGLNILNPEREKAVLDHAAERNAGPLDDEAVRRIFRCIIEECRNIEHGP
jgi:chorismate mutase-like protein